MAETLIKNKRFKTGTTVDIHYNPVFETNTIDITDSSLNGVFKVTATLDDSISAEIASGEIEIGDIAAFSYEVGTISNLSAYQITVDFPNSAFPDGDIARFIGEKFQHILFFKVNDNIMPDMVTGNFEEIVEQATYGLSKIVYNLRRKTILRLAPIRMIDDGVLSAVISSSGFVLKSCDDSSYDIDTGSWYSDFPIQLSGSSIDPVYRRAYLTERVMKSKGRRASGTLDFTLIG